MRRAAPLQIFATQLQDIPEILTQKHIEMVLHVTSQTAREMMQAEGFPLIVFGRLKMTLKHHFLLWLENEYIAAS